MTEKIDKRTSGYKSRQEALLSGPEVITAMIDRTIAAGVSVSYALMDSWFTQLHQGLSADFKLRKLSYTDVESGGF